MGLTVTTGPRVASGVTALVDQVWGADLLSPTVWVGTDESAVPRTHRVVERYLVAPSLANPRYLVPLESGAVARASLSRYNGLRARPTRVRRAVLGAGLRPGVTQAALRDRLVVALDRDVPRADEARWLLSAHLRDVLGVPALVMGTGVQPPSPHRKPTLLLLDLSGRVLGFAKLGYSDSTRLRVSEEARMMGLVRDSGVAPVHVPSVLHTGTWHDRGLSVVAPLPDDVRHFGPPSVPPPVAVTRALAGVGALTREPLGTSRYWRGLEERSRGLAGQAGPAGSDGLTTALRYARARVLGGLGDAPVELGVWHGDWVPWNLAWSRACGCGGRASTLWAWDWEYATEQAPLGFDLAHWFFQRSFVLGRSTPEEAVAATHEAAREPLQRLGIPSRLVAGVVDAYVLEMALRHLELDAVPGATERRVAERLLSTLGTQHQEGVR